MIRQGGELVDLASDPVALIRATGGLISSLINDPKATAAALGIEVAGGLQEKAYLYLQALNEKDYTKAGDLISDIVVQVALAVGTGGAGKAAYDVLKQAKISENLLGALEKFGTTRAAKVEAKAAEVLAKTSQAELSSLARLFDRSDSLNNLKINGKTIEVGAGGNGKTVLIMESQLLSDAEILAYAEKLAGGSLKVPPSGAANIWTAKTADGATINLRTVSSSFEQTGARWTIDINKSDKIIDVVKSERLELKFR